jgi:hypothetical protein
MKKHFLFVLCTAAILLSMIYVCYSSVEVSASRSLDPTKVYGVRMLWNNSMTVNDIAVSKDGNYIAVANNTGVYYFAYNDSSPIWWYQTESAVVSATISADGRYTAVGLNSGYIYYFANATTRVGNQSAVTWTTYYMGGAIEKGTLDMSDDGEYVAAGGTGPNVFYYANCTKRQGEGLGVTWGYWLSSVEILTVDLSPDGKYFAFGGMNYSTLGGFVAFNGNANIEPYPTGPDWICWNSTSSSIISSVAVSDDGYGVAAASALAIRTLHYWANATILSGDPNATWTTDGPFMSVDIDADGNNIVAGSLGPIPTSLHFWSNARTRAGIQTEDWIRLDSSYVWDAAINDDGNIIACSAQTDFTNYTAHFFWSNGTLIDEFPLNQLSPIVSMSGDGRITAMGGPGFDSLYVFELLVDDNPPLIENVYQIPASDSVYPVDSVAVYANVTDDYSGVKHVFLGYTIDNETWFMVLMTNIIGNQYNGTIPQFPYCTNVNYDITAMDNYDNTITTTEMGYDYKYHVTPEFSLQILIPLFITVTALTMILQKRKRTTHSLS